MYLLAQSVPLGIYNQRLAIVLGFITLASGMAVVLTCRSFFQILPRVGIKNPLKNAVYNKAYSFHAYFWWIFIMGLILHLMTALFHTGLPAAGDPDAPVHWVILGLAAGSVLLLTPVLLSCRSIATFFNFVNGKSPLNNNTYGWLFRRHGLFWWPFIVCVSAHFLVAYIHTGIWPH